LAAVLETEGAMNVIALSLRSPSSRTRALVLEIFGAVCLLPGGHTSVLEGLEAVCEVSMMRFRFEIIVYTLWNSCTGTQQQDKDLQVASMSFINAVVCGGPGSIFKYRMHMRWEFINLGLLQLIDKIGTVENELLQTQIDVWIAGLEADEMELFSKLNTKELNVDDTKELSLALDAVMRTSTCEGSYQSLLKHLALLPTASFERMKYMLIIDRLVQQIVLQVNGEDLDPSACLVNLDMRVVTGEVENLGALQEQELRYQKQVEKARKLENENEVLKSLINLMKGNWRISKN
jgi:dishevelled associated activator of morphogenesis